MEGNGTSATAMLVGTPRDVGGRPDAATVTMAREEIEEALASDAPLELILTVDRGAGTPQDVRVAWQRSDLETVLAGTDAGGVTFSFDRAELYRALEHPDFEGHGIREMVLLTVAAASASAALAASTASGQLMEGTGGGGATATVVAPGHGEATTARDLATPAIHDEATLAARGVDRIVPGADEAGLAARGIHTPAVHDEGTLVSRGIEAPAVPADSSGSFELPSLDAGTAAAVGGLAGAGLLIVGAAFVARRQRTTPA